MGSEADDIEGGFGRVESCARDGRVGIVQRM